MVIHGTKYMTDNRRQSLILACKLSLVDIVLLIQGALWEHGRLFITKIGSPKEISLEIDWLTYTWKQSIPTTFKSCGLWSIQGPEMHALSINKRKFLFKNSCQNTFCTKRIIHGIYIIINNFNGDNMIGLCLMWIYYSWYWFSFSWRFHLFTELFGS